MPAKRKYAEDISYREAHRTELRRIVPVYGAVMDCIDIDMVENCHLCNEPFCLMELVQDRGQDLQRKSTAKTVALATRADLPAFLVAYRTDGDFDANNAQTNVVGIKARQVCPVRTPLLEWEIDEWWWFVASLHICHWHDIHSDHSLAHKHDLPSAVNKLVASGFMLNGFAQLWKQQGIAS